MKADSAIFTAFEEHKSIKSSNAERNLMRAILGLSMDDIKKGGEKARDARRFFSDQDFDYIYSFENICIELELCSKTIRKLVGIMAVSERIDNVVSGIKTSN